MAMISRSRPIVPAEIINCLLLGAFAIVAALFSNSHLMFALVVAAVALLATRELWHIVTNPKTIRFSRVLAASILLGYVVGTAVYLGHFQTTDAAAYQYWQDYGLHYDQHSLALALAAALAASAMLYATSLWEAPKSFGALLNDLLDPKAERIVWLGMLFVVAALYSGQIGYMGATKTDSGRITALGALAVLVTPPLVPYTLAVATAEHRLPRRFLLSTALIFFIAVTFILGRRYLLYVLVLSAIVMFARGYRLSSKHWAILAIFATMTALALYWGFKFFMALRLAVWELGPDAGLRKLISASLSMLGSSQSREVSAQLAENVGTRTFILSYFGGLVGIDNWNVPALGKELLYSIQMAVPSLLMPGKTAVLPSTPEELMHPLYGIPAFDGPNTIIVAGYDDFGFIGAALYPLALIMLYCGFYAAVCRIIRRQSIRLFVIFTLLFQLLYVEQSLTASFVVLRDLIIILCLFWLVMRVPVVRFARRRQWDGHSTRCQPPVTGGPFSDAAPEQE